MGASGCVAWMFDRKGVLIVSRESGADEDELMNAAIEAGADDFNADKDVFEITTGSWRNFPQSERRWRLPDMFSSRQSRI